MFLRKDFLMMVVNRGIYRCLYFLSMKKARGRFPRAFLFCGKVFFQTVFLTSFVADGGRDGLQEMK